MTYQDKGLCNLLEHKCKCRESAAVKCSDNLYEQTRVRVVRVMREFEDVSCAAEELGISEKTVRKYMRFVPFEHLMHDPSLEDRFDWRSMTEKKWTRLLRKHPQFITRMPKKRLLSCRNECEILIAQPQLAPYFDLEEWNRLEMGFNWSELLSHRPQLADRCDFSVIQARAAANLLEKQPQFFDKIPLETLWAYHWTEIFCWQPHLEKKMLARPHSEWPFNFWVHALQYHPELEQEFNGWKKVEDQDIPDFKRTQPEMYLRHWNAKKISACEENTL